jgi:hypothetical protein
VWLLLLVAVVVVSVVGHGLRSNGFDVVAVVLGNYCNVDVVINDYRLDS